MEQKYETDENLLVKKAFHVCVVTVLLSSFPWRYRFQLVEFLDGANAYVRPICTSDFFTFHYAAAVWKNNWGVGEAVEGTLNSLFELGNFGLKRN